MDDPLALHENAIALVDEIPTLACFPCWMEAIYSLSVTKKLSQRSHSSA
jgi:hypothetical protein